MLNIEYAKNPAYANADQTIIDLLVKFIELDVEVPFTATSTDTEKHGADLYNNALNGDYGIIGNYVAPQQDKANIIANYKSAAQSQLDSLSQSWGYDSILSAASYVNSTNAQFKAESLALIAWRDEVWASAYALLASVQSGKKSAPNSADDFLAGLPVAPDRPIA